MTNSGKATLVTCLIALGSFLLLSSLYIFMFKEKWFLDFVGYVTLFSGIFVMLSGSLVKGIGDKLYPDRGVQRQVYGEVKNDFSGVIDGLSWSTASHDARTFLILFNLMIIGCGSMVGAAISFSIIRFL